MPRLDPLTHRLASHPPSKPVALMYHAITDHPWPWAISLDKFRRQLGFLHEHGYSTVTVSELEDHPAALPYVALTFDDGYADNLAAIEALCALGMRATWFVVTGSLGRKPAWEDPGRPPVKLLSAADLREMHRAGMEIGSHTVSHRDLTTLTPAQLKRELRDSRLFLEDILGASVTSFAYPYGCWNETVESAVREAGYRRACTTRTGWALLDQNPFQIRRLTIHNRDNLGTFARKLTFGSHEVEWPHILMYGMRRLLARCSRDTKA